MKLDRKLIEHVAKIARLNLSEQEIKEFLPQLKEILLSFQKIQEVNTKSTKPSYHSIELKNVMREDTPEKCLDNDTALQNTKHKKDGYFKGPRVV